MERRDLLIVVLGLVIVMAMALFVKPVITGKPPDLSLPFQATPTQSPTPTLPAWAYETPRPPLLTTVPPTWSGSSKDLGFVAGTPIPTTAQLSPTHMIPPDVPPQKSILLEYATIEGKTGGTTENLSMPFPYWELHYTVDPWETTFVGETSSKEAGHADSFGVEIFPSFSIDVMDADDHTLVRRIEPMGGLDPDLWEKGEDYDPRPWIEKFYEGNEVKTYYFRINTHMIRFYRIDIMVPDRYVGRY